MIDIPIMETELQTIAAAKVQYMGEFQTIVSLLSLVNNKFTFF